MRLLSVVLVVLLAVATAGAEVVVLTDGTRVEGKLTKTSNGWTITKSDGSTVTITSDKVRSIEPGGASGSGSASPQDLLASLRRAVEHQTDIDQIISRYQMFIAQTTDAATLADANQDLATWRQRKQDGLVKVGDKWVSGEERQKMVSQAQTEAIEARDLIVQNKMQAAEGILTQALKDDPQCAPAVYLEGVVQYSQGKWPVAQKTFDGLNTLLPKYGPTLNNLGVILWKQRSYVGAMNVYVEAMEAAPQNRVILDNVAEALNALPDEFRKAPAVPRAALLFQQQDTALQKQAAAQGLYRWGATWVTAAQLADLKASEAKIKDQLAGYQKQYDDLELKIKKDDDLMASNKVVMDQEMGQSTVGGGIGSTQYQQLLPPMYYTLQGDNERMTAEKVSLTKQEADIRAQMDKVRRTLPMPQYTGILNIIGAEGAPLQYLVTDLTANNFPEAVPAAQPATRR